MQCFVFTDKKICRVYPKQPHKKRKMTQKYTETELKKIKKANPSFNDAMMKAVQRGEPIIISKKYQEDEKAYFCLRCSKLYPESQKDGLYCKKCTEELIREPVEKMKMPIKTNLFGIPDAETLYKPR